MNTHTPEPWAAVRNTAYWEIGTEIDGYYANRIGDVCATDPNHPDAGKQEANATRIVACVNACKGINPEAVPDLLEACKEAKEWLVAMTLKAAFNQENKVAQDEASQIVREVSSHLSAAIAKAEGGAA